MTLDFFLPMDPPRATAQEHQVRVIHGRPMFYDPPRLKDAKTKLRLALRRHKPSLPLQGAVKLTVVWRFKKGRYKDGELKITKPDTDNLQKMLKDCMKAEGFWTDDAQVAIETVVKIWSAKPGIEIEIEEAVSGQASNP